MPNRSLPRQIVAFAVVGAVNTATYYGLYLLFLIRLPYLAAHTLAFTLSMTGSFFLNARFTYRTRPTWRKFLLFPLTNVTNFVITTAGVYLIVDVLHAGHRYAPLLASAAAIPVTFVVSRRVMLPAAKPAAPAGTGDSGGVRGTADAA
ncbi:GtrA family protein [Streptomyces dangxiongensis]|uniref:GtrA family protein n=1 Tax=Streptomyces dangxiongensis TaxID=1442032 RepID=A0A3G2JQC7_9ACTN|nr:GtrA family protein [Streptomyces dangxiongensis]AYN42257.1 GtrA family protein [Streptomyces dangxiongensis]